MHDPHTKICSFPPYHFNEKLPHWMRLTLFDLWHIDPCTDGSDDSCGWFMHSRHGDEKVLEKIIKAFEFEWDWVYIPDHNNDEESEIEDKRVYPQGWFYPETGTPVYSPMAIAIGMFTGAMHCMGWNFERTERFMQSHLYQILQFAENPVDSLYDSFVMKWGRDLRIDELDTPATRARKLARWREDRIRNFASIVYAWILRESRPWYKHPRWHVWHWEIKLPVLQMLRRWLFDRCCKCGRGFKINESVIGTLWGPSKPKMFQSSPGLMHEGCAHCGVAKSETPVA